MQRTSRRRRAGVVALALGVLGTVLLPPARRVGATTTPPTISIGSASVVAARTAARLLAFPVTLSHPGTSAISVAYATSPGTAHAGSAYVTASGHVTFLVDGATGHTATMQSIYVAISKSSATSTLRFSVTLSSPSGGRLGNSVGTGTIVAPPPSAPTRADAADSTVYRSESGTGSAFVTVTLSQPAPQPVQVGYTIDPGTAQRGVDFVAPSSGSLTFASGAAESIVGITTLAQPRTRGTRTVLVHLTSANGASVGDGTATITILPQPVALLFDDEFNAGTLSSAWYPNRWFADDCAAGANSNEAEAYRKRNVAVANGVLVLTAKADTSCSGKSYTSGWVQTGGARTATGTRLPPGFTFTYGRVAVHFRTPAGAGFWPAIWLLSPGTSQQYPTTPEVDELEQYMSSPTRWMFHVHLGTADSGNTVTGPDTASGYHTVALDWRANKITYFVDGTVAWTYTGPGIPTVPMYLIVDLAVGGSAPGPIDTSALPAHLDVDWVRVSQ